MVHVEVPISNYQLQLSFARCDWAQGSRLGKHADTEQWWPSRYGEGDQLGSLNEITPAKVVAAAQLVRSGTVYDLGRTLHADVPHFPGRFWQQTLVTSAHLNNPRRPGGRPGGWGVNKVNWMIELVTGTLQIDIAMSESDKLAVNGTLDITGATLNVTGTLTEPLYQIVSAQGPITGTFGSTSIPAGYSLQYHQNTIVLLSDTAPAYEVWAAGLSDPSPDADIEGDGLANVLEFILNSNPNAGSLSELPDVSTNPNGDLVFTFVRKSSSAYLGAVVEYSTSLADGSWTTFGGATVQPDTPGAGLDTVTATLPASLAGAGQRIFARLKVDVP